MLSGAGQPEATAFWIHSRLHAGRPGSGAVFHTHQAEVTALTCLEDFKCAHMPGPTPACPACPCMYGLATPAPDPFLSTPNASWQGAPVTMVPIAAGGFAWPSPAQAAMPNLPLWGMVCRGMVSDPAAARAEAILLSVDTWNLPMVKVCLIWLPM